ncbi:hypothetical protein DL96DRAFT_1631701 [Flagelloscypha sp. PMI_526]|nr:hypothetical protein DL96DRAFT_1631701 [Flagelloscypha sp. PMI_526]
MEIDLENFQDAGLPSPTSYSDKVGSPQDALAVFDDEFYTHASRLARWMDLVGDYGGKEFFVIEGESLLQNVLDTPTLALGRRRDPKNGHCDNSFQIVHALFLLEKIILEFTSRDTFFELVFFEDCKHSTVSTGDDSFVTSSRSLARKLLFQHLQTRLQVDLHIFKDAEDPEWKLFVVNKQPMFVLINDGGIPTTTSSPLECQAMLVRRRLLLQLARQNLPFALLRGAEYRDSKINTFVFESSSLARKTRLPGFALAEITSASPALNESLGYHLPLPTSHEITKTSSISGDSIFHVVFRSHLDVLPSLPVECRARKLPALHAELESELYEHFLPQVFQQLTTSPTSSPDVDGRIFLELLVYVIQTGTSPDLPYFEGVDLASLASRYPLPDAPLPEAPQATEPSPDTTLKPSVFGSEILIDDVRHWHNSRSILPTYLGGQRPQPATEWERRKRFKREQRDQARLQKQAASLTGASGGVLVKVLIPAVGSSNGTSGKGAQKRKPEKPKKSAGSEKAREKIIAEKDRTDGAAAQKWWGEKLKSLKDKGINIEMETVLALKQSASSKASYPAVAVEIRLYLIHLVLKRWSTMDENEAEAARDSTVVQILRALVDLRSTASAGIGEDAHAFLTSVCETIGFGRYISSLVPSRATPPPGQPKTAPSSILPLTFKPIKLERKKVPVFPFMSVMTDPVQWQLEHFGEFMDRSMDSASDPRVSFAPDKWQRDVLNAIDHGKSILALAPTSAGKTFISFYAMEKVLRESNDGVLVYVAPTKALVNQIAAEIYGRFSKTYPGNETLLAVQTRDTRTGDIQRAQILVTVPEMLGILILSPTLAGNWTSRIRRIILDEIHSIGQDEGGAVWEQIILLSPCPVIGLSATVGSPEGFNGWLRDVQVTHNFKHEYVHHPHRYSHLRKFFYLPSKSPNASSFTGLHTHQSTSRAVFLHPISLLSEHARTLPSDLALEARDCLSLYQALKDLGILDGEHLAPPKSLRSSGELLRQADILRYEAELKEVVVAAISQPEVLKGITKKLSPRHLDATDAPPSRDDFLDNLIALLADLHAEDKLPAILFNFDRTNCEIMAMTVTDFLEEAEEEWKNKSAEWKSKLKRVEEWRRGAALREKQREREARQKKDHDAFREGGGSLPWEATFDENEPLPEFSFAGRSSSKEELEEIMSDLEKPWVRTPRWAIDCLKRGIAVHHAGMPKAYRAFLCSIICLHHGTGTLALGINAPARTSVFCGDSPYLTALMYRQCAGRAGRRGFDLLGNVVFYGLSYARVQRLVLSRLPSLGDSFPLTSTLILRLFNLLAGSNSSAFSVTAIQSLLNLPRISHRSTMGRDQVLHHVRFSIDYLRYSGLLNSEGQPTNLFSMASHLYYAEPSNFALVHLFEDGIIHKICNGPSATEAEEQVLLVLCHLFGRKFIPGNYLRPDLLDALRKKYPSRIVLPPLPAKVATALQKHDKKILEIFSSYATTYSLTHLDSLGIDNALPLSGAYPTATPLPSFVGFADHLKITHSTPTTRSVFAASSGLDDTFTSVSDLVSTVRQGIHLHEHAIPSMQGIVAHSELPGIPPVEHALNAYILDFYTHGQLPTLSSANGIRRGDVWYLLQEFELVLKAIRACLREILLRLSKARGAEIDESVEEDESVEAKEEDEDEFSDGEFKRPPKTKEQDWKVYQVVNNILNIFEEKYRKIFA